MSENRLIDYGRQLERERIMKIAEYWISEMKGHDGECTCRHDAEVIQQFIDSLKYE